MLELSEDGILHENRRDDLISIQILSADVMGMTTRIREIVPSSDNIWLAQALYIFYPELYFDMIVKDNDVSFDVLLQIIFNNKDLSDLENIYKRFTKIGKIEENDHLVSTIQKILFKNQSAYEITTPNFTFVSRDFLQQYLLNLDKKLATDFPIEKRVNMFISDLIMKYFLFLQPFYKHERQILKIINVPLTQNEAKSLFENFNLLTWTIDRLNFAIMKEIDRMREKISETFQK